MSTYEISKSSILSLKAEILRKQEEIKSKGGTEQKNKLVKKKITLENKNKNVEKRGEKDSIEDNEILKQSRLALERKAKLYEKLTNSKIIDDDPSHPVNRFLVRFKDKTGDFVERDDDAPDEPPSEEDDTPREYDDRPKNAGDEWVEYVDCLGRTRTCLRKDLEYFKSKERDYRRSTDREEPPKKTPEIEPKDNEPPELLTDDMRREMLRKQWEKEEEELMNKDSIHYQDILFSEARVHGVGYYGFSKDEDERKKQQEALKKLRAETLSEQKKQQEIKSKREQQMAARLKAAKNRKRARMGLPPLEDEEELIGPPVPESVVEEPPDEEKEKTEKLLEEARKKHVRPWDIGKEKKKHYEYTQEEWIEKQRKERRDEFAPSYSRGFRSDVQGTSVCEKRTLDFTTKKIKPDTEDPFNEETGRFEYKTDGREVPVKRSKIGGDIEDSVEAGLKFLRTQSEKGGKVRDFENADMFSL